MIDKIISHYKILEKLGAGDMGTVYKHPVTNLEQSLIFSLKYC